MAGLADFKTELAQSDMLDQRLAKIIVKIVDVSYGGDNGFNQVSFDVADQIPIDIFGKDFVAY
jgi:peptide chain release factor subunit 1